MAGFTSSWLDLREAADAHCRSGEFAHRLAAHLGSLDRVEVADLGSGTGANLRWLAPLLPVAQRWHLLERDPALLSAIAPRLRTWARRRDLHATSQHDGITLTGSHDLQITWHQVDLNPDPLPLDRVHLVTASALADLVSARWLTGLVSRCVRTRCAVLLAINYDGRIAMTPRHDLDPLIRDAQNRHQRGDKGFGPALGPTAAAWATHCLQSQGYRVRQARSDWVLGGDQAPLLRHLLDGWRRNARDVMSQDAGSALNAWHTWHTRHLEHGTSTARVGHVDLLALPPT